MDETHDDSDEFSAAGSDSAFSEPSDATDGVFADRRSEQEPDEPAQLPVRFRGDEPELYLKFNRQLVAKIDHAVVAQREDVEDACAFAWVQFLRHQPDRDQNWQGWLFRTAQREAWRLSAIRRSELRLRSEMPDRGLTDPDRSTDPVRRLEQRQQFEEAIVELKQIPKPMQEVVLVASQVRRHRDVGEILDIPETRVGYLLASAGAALGEAAERRAERERPVASPRAHACASSRTLHPNGSSRQSAARRPEARMRVRRSWLGGARHSRSTTTATTTAGLQPTRDSARDRPTISWPGMHTNGRIRRSSASAPSAHADEETLSNDDGHPDPAAIAMELVFRCSTPGLWSRRPRVRVPSLTPQKSLQMNVSVPKRTVRSYVTGTQRVQFVFNYHPGRRGRR